MTEKERESVMQTGMQTTQAEERPFGVPLHGFRHLFGLGSSFVVNVEVRLEEEHSGKASKSERPISVTLNRWDVACS